MSEFTVNYERTANIPFTHEKKRAGNNKESKRWKRNGGCGLKQAEQAPAVGKRLYENGGIAALGEGETGGALLCEDGVVTAVYRKGGRPFPQEPAERVDLRGGILLPGFADVRERFFDRVLSEGQADLSEVTGADGKNGLREVLSSFAKRHEIPPGQWILGRGCDSSRMKERPTAAMLDEAFPDYPVMVTEAGGHAGVFNTTAMMMLGLPPAKPEGYYAGEAFLKAAARIPSPRPETVSAAFRERCRTYLAEGVAVVAQGLYTPSAFSAMRDAASSLAEMPEIFGYASPEEAEAVRDVFQAETKRNKRLRFCGVRLDVLEGTTAAEVSFAVGQAKRLSLPLTVRMARGTEEEARERVRRTVGSVWPAVRFLPWPQNAPAAFPPLRFLREETAKRGEAGRWDALRKLTSVCGTIAVGKPELFSLFDRDITAAPPEGIAKARGRAVLPPVDTEPWRLL